MLNQKEIQQMHCGLFHCKYDEAIELMPELGEAWKSFSPEHPKSEYIMDVKIHMLMPNQYPCIPNWHFDMVPRVNGKQDFTKITNSKMYLWLSNEPFTEFKDGRKIEKQQWNTFTQNDEHRGTLSNDHIWRVFIRAAHKSLLTASEGSNRFRRHAQVYLDSNNFKW